jgi:hypothetical protein
MKHLVQVRVTNINSKKNIDTIRTLLGTILVQEGPPSMEESSRNAASDIHQLLLGLDEYAP